MVALKRTSSRCPIPTPLHQPALHYLSEDLIGSADLWKDVEQLKLPVRRVEVEQRDRPALVVAPRTAAVSQSAGGALLLSILRGQQAAWTQQCAGSGQWGAPPPASRSALRHGRGQHGPRRLDDRHRRRGAPPTVCRGAPLEPHTPRTATPSTLGSPELARGPQTARADDEEEQGATRPAQRLNAADCGRACSALDP